MTRMRWSIPMKTGALLALALAAASAAPGRPVTFESFEYTGRDAVFSAPLEDGHYRNPVLAGFYPDPDICRVGDDYYVVNSSFGYFPGIPVFHSRDLVNWKQVGSVIDRPGQLDYKGLGVSRGIFAPSLSYRAGTFYLICTFVDGGGNFLVTAANPAGPWSDPTWLGFDGIDPSILLDDDGRAWVVNNGAPPDNKPLYSGHRAIWIQELDLANRKLVGTRTIIVNGGVNLADHPVWIEAPHLFRKDGWYYLICAEGGTAEQHSEVVFRSRSVLGPFVPGPTNPILTQRTLPDSRADPVTSTGHAELVSATDGTWWAVFLGCRPYRGGDYNTGRETFMLPATWTDGWPTILAPGLPVPYSVPSPLGASVGDAAAAPLTGNFTWRDDFRGPRLSKLWMGLRALPQVTLGAEGLGLTASQDALSGVGYPAFVARRIQHARFTASTTLLTPSEGVSAGLAAFQNEAHHYFFGVHRGKAGLEVFVERLNGTPAERIAREAIADTGRIELRMTEDDSTCSFEYSCGAAPWRTLLEGADATLLSTRVAGGFVGAVVGPHARIDP